MRLQDIGSLDPLISLCKRRGFIFQSSEIYGGLASAWDYGPLGVELKNRIQHFWWQNMTQFRNDIVGIDTAILMHPRVWEASGHLAGFIDLMAEDTVTHERYRWDHLSEENRQSMVSPKGNRLSEPRPFNLMFQTHIGSTESSEGVTYLRPETAQGIYVNFRNIVQTSRKKIPFGIAQVGKAFRNEIATKNFIFRTCEFEQMEMQFFVSPDEDKQWFDYWKDMRMDYYRQLGINGDNLRLHRHGADELAHYAKDAFDIQYRFPFGWQELEGIHNRADFDLSRHIEYSGKDLHYVDEQTKKRYIPHIIETSAGLTRNVLMALSDSYEEEIISDGDKRAVLHLHPSIAPITIGVFPLVKKDGLSERAQNIEKRLRRHFTTFYDQGGAIGRRYRRQDEIGTPFCVTIDYETMENNTATIRERDSMRQTRVSVGQIETWIREAIDSWALPTTS